MKKLILKPKNNKNILDEIYAHPEEFLSRAKLLRKEDISCTTRSEISDLVKLFARQYLLSVLRKDNVYVDGHAMSTYNGQDIFDVLRNEYVTEENTKNISSVMENVTEDRPLFYIEDLYENKGSLYINISYLEMGYDVNKFEQREGFQKENYALGRN